MDRFSPLRPACVRVLVLPIGQLERTSFLEIVTNLQNTCSIVPLKELYSQSAHADSLFKPEENSVGSLIYNFVTASAPEQQQQYSSPFELWREPLLVLGIVSSSAVHSQSRHNLAKDALEVLRERHARVIHRHLLVLRDSEDTQHDFSLPNATHLVQDDTDSTLSERLLLAVQSISRQFLQELSTYGQAMQASPSIQTPGQPVQSHLRPMLVKDDDRPRSNHSTPVEPRSPSGDDSASRPTSKEFLPPPATSFDQIAAANTVSRSDSHGSRRSKSRARASSFDRVPVQALSKEKLKDRGKARVGVVIGSIHLLAGQWTEALKVLVDNTTRLRALSDHIWHGKGLENIFVCLLLHVWAGLDFQVPPICYQLSDKVRDRLSKAIAAEIQQRVSTQQTPIEKLSASAPELLSHILLLYRAVESTLELPYLVVTEATVRLCKALTVLHNANGTYYQKQVDAMLRIRQQDDASRLSPSSLQISTPSPTSKLSKTSIADLLAHVFPLHEENIKTQDQISILTGVASVYALLGMQRKKIVVLRSLVNHLVLSMDQARKVGAAEMGIHPAASLSMENASDAASNAFHGSKGLLHLAQDMVAVLGLQLSTESSNGTTKARQEASDFGSQLLRSEVLRDLLRLCESTSDLQGISTLVSACMLSVMPCGFVDASTSRPEKGFAAEEQTRLVSMMMKAQNLSHQLGVPESLADYWDAHLVRDISFRPANNGRTLVKLATNSSAATSTAQSNSNPLLYDPNAPKSKEERQLSTVACGEQMTCQVTLQNNLDTVVEIEQLELITEGVALAAKINNIVLGRSCVQQISFEVTPEVIGEANVTGCLIKIVGCHEQKFPIVKAADGPSYPPTVKEIGQDVLHATSSSNKKDIAEGYGEAAVNVLPPQPYLTLKGDVVPASDLMLLDGEIKHISLTLENTSGAPAILRRIDCPNGLRHISGAADHQNIAPSQTASFDFKLTANDLPDVVSVNFLYSADVTADYARTCTVRVNTTVQPGIQVDKLVAVSQQDDSVDIALDMTNLWQMPVTIGIEDSPSSDAARSIAAGHTQRYHMTVKRWTQNLKAQSDPNMIMSQLRERLRLQWSSGERAGEVPLSPAMFTSDILELVRGPSLAINLHIGNKQHDARLPEVKAGSFFALRALVENRSVTDSDALRVQLFCQTQGVTAQEARRGIAVVGSVQRLVPAIPAAGQSSAEFALCALSTGVLEISATIKSILPKSKGMVEGHTENRLIVKVIE